jgi:6-pyruvoyl-tetrahydropterin synthase
MAGRLRNSNKTPTNIIEEAKDLKTSRSLPLKRVAKIVNNYTKRYYTKLIPEKKESGKMIEYASIEEMENLSRTQWPEDESLLNSVRTSPPKAEMTANMEKSLLIEDVAVLKKQISGEKVKYGILEQTYKELLSMFTQNEISYKTKIAELEKKIEDLENPERVTRAEFNRLTDRVAKIEMIITEENR